MKDDDLLPCPFCGTKAVSNDWGNEWGHSGWAIHCESDDCYARISYGDHCERSYLVEKWNKRHNPSIQPIGPQNEESIWRH